MPKDALLIITVGVLMAHISVQMHPIPDACVSMPLWDEKLMQESRTMIIYEMRLQHIAAFHKYQLHRTRSAIKSLQHAAS